MLAAALMAAGCAHRPEFNDGLDFGERQARLLGIDRWEMRGRLAIDTGERAFQARFRWREDSGEILLTVRGPLGAGSFQIDGTADSLTVQSRGERLVLTDPESELSQMFGWWLPVTSLSAWLLGLPAPNYPAESLENQTGSLARLDQRLWRLEYEEYQVAEGLLVPRKMTMNHGSVELRLTVDAWGPLAQTTDALN